MTADTTRWKQLKHNDKYAVEAGYATWVDWCVALSEQRGYAICGGRSRDGKDKPCEQRPRKARNRCSVHGGATLVGVEAPNYKGRGYSKDMPIRLAERFKAAMDDPELTSLISEIALVDVRIAELLEKFDLNESAEAWNLVAAAAIKIRNAIEAIRALVDEETDDGRRKVGELVAGIDFLDDAIQAGARDRTLWHELFGTVEVRRKLVDTEGKREDRLQQMITARQTMEVFGALQMILTDEIEALPLSDDDKRQLLSQIAGRLRNLLNRERGEQRSLASGI